MLGFRSSTTFSRCCPARPFGTTMPPKPNELANPEYQAGVQNHLQLIWPGERYYPEKLAAKVHKQPLPQRYAAHHPEESPGAREVA